MGKTKTKKDVAHSSETLMFQDYGPIPEFELPIPEGGGLVVIRGPRGRGKSHLLRSFDHVRNGGGKLPLRDGAVEGSIDFSKFGVQVRIGRTKTTYKGDAKFITLGERFSLKSLIDPGFATPERNDAERIRQLISLTGAELTRADFEALVDEEFRDCINDASVNREDPTEAAKYVKRDLQGKARNFEDQAAVHSGKADAFSKTCDGIDDSEADSLQEYEQQHLKAVQYLGKLQERQVQQAMIKSRGDEAQRKLLSIEVNRPKASLEDLRKEHEHTSRRVLDQEEHINALRSQLETARQELATLLNAQKLVEQQKLSAENWQSSYDALHTQIEAANGIVLDTNDVDSAESFVADLLRKRDIAKRALDARSIKDAAKKERDLQRSLEKKASSLRLAADSIDDLLTRLVEKSGVPFGIKLTDSGPRLTTKTDRGDEVFDDLSESEKNQAAIDTVIAQIHRLIAEGVTGFPVLAIPQEVYQGFAPSDKVALATRLREEGIYGYTAEPADGELTVEVI